MELLERYLHAVKFWLPKAQKEDIVAELSDDIRSEITAKEAELNRALNPSEVEGILKNCGRPILVAQRYLPQQHLIGPVLYPVYTFVLKIWALCYLLPWVLVWMIITIWNRPYRYPLPVFLKGWSDLWLMTLSGFAIITVVFVVIERVNAKSRFIEEWNPRKLPAVRDPLRIPRGGSIGEISGAMVGSIWWLYVPYIPAYWGNTLHLTFAPIWKVVYWAVFLPFGVSIVLGCVNLFRPRWTSRRALMRLCGDGFMLVLDLLLLSAGHSVSVYVPRVSAVMGAHIQGWVNLSLILTLSGATLVQVILCIQDAVRIGRTRASAVHSAGERVSSFS